MPGDYLETRDIVRHSKLSTHMVGYLCRSVVDGAQLQRRLLRMTTLASFLAAAEEAFSALPAEALDLGAAPRPS